MSRTLTVIWVWVVLLLAKVVVAAAPAPALLLLVPAPVHDLLGSFLHYISFVFSFAWYRIIDYLLKISCQYFV